MTTTFYALHYGTRRNEFYALYARPPIVQQREVEDPRRPGRTTTLYESPDPLELNLCVTQFERLTGLKLPLGGVAEVQFVVKDA